MLKQNQAVFGILIFMKNPITPAIRVFGLIASTWFMTSSMTFANPNGDPLAKSCIDQQLRNHQNVKNRSLDASDFSNYCTCFARVVRNLASDQQLSQLQASPHQAKPEWLKGIERSAQKQCMIDPSAKLQST